MLIILIVEFKILEYTWLVSKNYQIKLLLGFSVHCNVIWPDVAHNGSELSPPPALVWKLRLQYHQTWSTCFVNYACVAIILRVFGARVCLW